MTVSVGDQMPEAQVRVLSEDGPQEAAVSEVFADKTVLLFAVPGAYTPTCHRQHLPGYLDHLESIRERGVDEVVCLAVNDPFVLEHWARETGALGRVTFLADGNGEFTRALGLEFDGGGAGLGVRAKRFAMLVRNGEIAELAVEDSPGAVTDSGAEEFLKRL